MPTFVLLSTIAALYAADVPMPLEMSALVMVGVILRVYIGRENKGNERRDQRLDELEAEAREQRHIKHEMRGHLTVVFSTLTLSLQQALKCECDAMAPAIPSLQAATARLEAIAREITGDPTRRSTS